MRGLPRLAGPCFYCGSLGPIQADHWVPRSRGGPDAIWNLVPACTLCNQDKWDMTPAEWIQDRLNNGLSWPPVWNHNDCAEAWDWHHHCVEIGRIAAERNRLYPLDWTCPIDDGSGICGGKHYQRGMCKKHNRRWAKYGNIYLGGKSPHQLELEAAVVWERKQIMKTITSLDDIHAKALRENEIWEQAKGCIAIENGKLCGSKQYYMPKQKLCRLHYRRLKRYGDFEYHWDPVVSLPERICAKCGEIYKPSVHNQKYCRSKQCYFPKSCAYCKNDFRAYRRNQEYCSAECRKANNIKPRLYIPMIKCGICDITFQPNTRHSKYCSRKCYMIKQGNDQRERNMARKNL